MSEVQPSPRADGVAARPAGARRATIRGVSETVARRVVVHGSVQGVFFRDTTRRRAQSRGVSGWVRNRSDGTVEALFEGAPDAVDSMVAFAGEGPRGASVERVDVDERAPEGLAGFEIR
jgi:acylphosphatase